MKRIFLLAALVALVVAPAAAQDMAPSLIAPNQPQDPRIAQQLQPTLDRLKTLLDKVKEATGGKIDPNTIDVGALKNYGLKGPNVTDVLQAALNLMQEYGFIDPQEKSVQPDLDPPGQPKLASCAARNPNLSSDQYGEFMGIEKSIDRARTFLEKNYVVLRQTEIHAKRLTDLANSAAGISGIAGLYWANSQANPNDPMNKAKVSFYTKYDGAQANGLNYLNDALKKMSEFERTTCGDSNWYLYYGLPYYNFMLARYTRPGAGAAQ